MTDEQLRKRAEEMIAAGKMPSIEEVARAVLETRGKYANEIRRARREAKPVKPETSR